MADVDPIQSKMTTIVPDTKLSCWTWCTGAVKYVIVVMASS